MANDVTLLKDETRCGGKSTSCPNQLAKALGLAL